MQITIQEPITAGMPPNSIRKGIPSDTLARITLEILEEEATLFPEQEEFYSNILENDQSVSFETDEEEQKFFDTIKNFSDEDSQIFIDNYVSK